MLIFLHRPWVRISMQPCNGRPILWFVKPAFYKGFIKYCKVGRLVFNEILQFCNSLQLFITLYSILWSLLMLFSECKNLVGNLIVSFLVVVFLTSSCWSSISFLLILSVVMAAKTLMTNMIFCCNCFWKLDCCKFFDILLYVTWCIDLWNSEI